MNKKIRKSSLLSRWMRNCIPLTCGVVLLIILLFSFIIAKVYTGNAEDALISKANATTEFFNEYIFKTYGEYYQSVYDYTASFNDADVLVLQFINTRGEVETSSNDDIKVPSDTEDIDRSLSSEKTTCWSGKTSSGIRLISVTAPLFSQEGSVIGFIRYVQDSSVVSRQIRSAVILAVIVGILIVAAVIISGVFFLRTVSNPLKDLTSLARQIAEGRYGIQAEKKHNDELGDLIDAINEMSLKIGENEKTQTEFISSVSHELRTPLTAITGWSETLIYDETISPDSLRGIGIISKESARLTKMVNELLEFTRIQDNRFNLNLEKLDVSGELEDSIYTYGKLLQSEGIQVSYTPSEQDMPLILGDPERLKQVFLNIMDNAAKYGRAAGKISVTCEASGEWTVIRFRDYGPGIPEDELPMVKKKFYKGSGKERGSGIGLAVCEEIVTRHNGKLELENSKDGTSGLIVTILLPNIKEEDLII